VIKSWTGGSGRINLPPSCLKRDYIIEKGIKLLANLEKGEVFKKDTPVQWYCRNCGYVHDGKAAAMKCPVCDHPQSYFELWVENY